MDLNQVTLPSTDIARSVEFYRGMGFIQIVDSPDYARFECPDGDSTFSVHRVEPPVESSEVVVYFETADLDEVVAGLAGQGYVFDQMPTDQRWLWREARLRDPDGNVLCLFYGGENRRNPPWRIG